MKPEDKYYKIRKDGSQIKNKKRKTWIRRKKRLAIYLRDSFMCVWCKDKIEDTKLSLDHIVPFSKIFDNSEYNLITACRSCNSKRKDRSIRVFAKDISHVTKEKSYSILKRIEILRRKKLIYV